MAQPWTQRPGNLAIGGAYRLDEAGTYAGTRDDHDGGAGEVDVREIPGRPRVEDGPPDLRTGGEVVGGDGYLIAGCSGNGIQLGVHAVADDVQFVELPGLDRGNHVLQPSGGGEVDG